MAAWDDTRCVAELHGYRVQLPDGQNEHWPAWNNWWSDAVRQAVSHLRGPAWCHACIHVGRTLESAHQETLALVYRFANQNGWDIVCTTAALNALDGVDLNRDQVSTLIQELQASGQTRFQGIETQYQGRGIGTAPCQASLQWAREHDYTWVLAMGAPQGIYAYAQFAGALPWTTYARQGFQPLPLQGQDELPAWAQGAAPPDAVAEAQAALEAGRRPSSFHSRLMALDLHR
jgi:GNAT superfamily N-acetyltransferase